MRSARDLFLLNRHRFWRRVLKTHHLFISHSWSYSDAYERLVGLLEDRLYFRYSNYSVPRYDPIHNVGTDAALRDAIQRRMAPCGVVIILAGVYASYSKWINKEIDLAKRAFALPKPIVAIRPWESERASRVVTEAADLIVRWNTESVVGAIRDLA